MKTPTRDFRRSERGAGLLVLFVVTVALTALIGGATLFRMVTIRKPTDLAIENIVNNRATPRDMRTAQDANEDFVKVFETAVDGGRGIGSGGPIPSGSDIPIYVLQEMIEPVSRPPRTKDDPTHPTQIPSRLDEMHKMVDDYTQIKNMINDIKYWNQVLGETVTEPRQISTTSQVASGRSVASDIELVQQQAIEKIRQERQDLVNLQNRMQDLINRYDNSRGRVGRDWSESWDRARQDWQRIIRDMVRPRPGISGSSGASRPPWGTSSDHPHDAAGRDIPSSEGNSGFSFDSWFAKQIQRTTDIMRGRPVPELE